ncbi:hypothetical protein LguiA_014260 [Lonicera macranthoides]
MNVEEEAKPESSERDEGNYDDDDDDEDNCKEMITERVLLSTNRGWKFFLRASRKSTKIAQVSTLRTSRHDVLDS